ncbi:MAG: hypothetical protein CMF57_06385 [Leifsonia sp.]|nr:hypothetical protein [Leifsonia sp.]
MARYGENVTDTKPPDRRLVSRPALVSSFLAPVFFIGGTIVAELAWPGFDPVAMTISELAAGDAPTRVFMTLMFVLTGVCHLVTAAFARGLAWPGRAALALAGVALFAVAAFPLPAVGESSPEHRYSAMAGFVLLALWPVLSMRFSPRYPWLVRPLGATLSTLAVGAACVAFAWIEASPDPALVGLAERVAAYLESLWPAVVVLALALRDRRVSARESHLRGG